MTITDPLRGALTSLPDTARDPRPSFRSTTCTNSTLATGRLAIQSRGEPAALPVPSGHVHVLSTLPSHLAERTDR